MQLGTIKNSDHMQFMIHCQLKKKYKLNSKSNITGDTGTGEGQTGVRKVQQQQQMQQAGPTLRAAAMASAKA